MTYLFSLWGGGWIKIRIHSFCCVHARWMVILILEGIDRAQSFQRKQPTQYHTDSYCFAFSETFGP